VQPECRKEHPVYYPDQNDSQAVGVTIIGGAECTHDYRPSSGGLTLTHARIVKPPQQGKLEQSGPLSLKYRPHSDASGSDEYEVEVCGSSPHGSGCSHLTYQIEFQ